METEGLGKELRYNLRTDRQMPPEALVSVQEGQVREEKKTHGNLTRRGKRDSLNQKLDAVEAVGPIVLMPQVHYLTTSYLLI